MSACVVLITAPRGTEARKLARMIVSRKLAACVNIVKGIDSVFWWKGRIDQAKEDLLLVKTTRSKVRPLIKATVKAHSYEVCEVIALPVVAGHRAYVKWIEESVR